MDATDKILGRLASTIAIHIRGKNLATYTPSVDMGAFVIVVCYHFTRLELFFYTLGLLFATTLKLTGTWSFSRKLNLLHCKLLLVVICNLPVYPTMLGYLSGLSCNMFALTMVFLIYL